MHIPGELIDLLNEYIIVRRREYVGLYFVGFLFGLAIGIALEWK